MPNIKTYLLTAWLLLSAGASMAQNTVYLEPRLGYGTFQMQPLKELQRSMVANTGMNAKVTDSYGPYFQFGFNVVFALSENTRLGSFFEHGSTGGRIAYSDYSGEFTLDTPVNYNALGTLIYHHQAFGESKLRHVLGAELQMMRTTLKLLANTKVYDMTDSSEDRFNSFGVGLKPFAGLQYPLLKLPITLSVGYLVDANNPFHVPGEPDQQIVKNSNNETIDPGWGGLRINLTVSVPITGKRD
jgi:hypothetical protein